MPIRLIWMLALLLLGIAGRPTDLVILTLDRIDTQVGLQNIPAIAPNDHVAMALMVARTQHSGDDRLPGEGFLTINAGATAGTYARLSTLVHDNRRWPSVLIAMTPTVGTLGDALQQCGYRTGALGSADALALIMNRRGVADVTDLHPVSPTAAELARVRAFLATVDVAAVDLTHMAGGDCRAILPWMRQLVARLPRSTPILLCAPNPRIDPAVPWPASWAVLLNAPERGTLFSASTQRAGLISSTDLPASILGWLGHAAPVGMGQALSVRSGEANGRALLHMNQALYARAFWRGTLFHTYMSSLTGILIALILLGLLWPRPGWQRLARGLAVVIPASWLMLACTGVTATSTRPLFAELAFGLAASVGIVLLAKRHRVFALWVAAGVAVVLGQTLAPDWGLYNQTSYMVLQGSRFYGLGNATAGLVATGLLAAAILGMRTPRLRGVTLAAPFVAAGWVFWSGGGANFGMGLAIGVLALTLLALQIPPGHRLRWCLAGGIAGLVALVALVWSDIASGGTSHIARLVLAIQQEGVAPLAEVVLRKASTAVRLLRGTDSTYVLEMALAATVIYLEKLRSWWTTSPRAHRLILASLIGMGAAQLLNDSGVEPASLLAVCLLTGLLGLEEEENAPVDMAVHTRPDFREQES